MIRKICFRWNDTPKGLEFDPSEVQGMSVKAQIALWRLIKRTCQQHLDVLGDKEQN